jgi:Dyp-type peroxidase family
MNPLDLMISGLFRIRTLFRWLFPIRRGFHWLFRIVRLCIRKLFRREPRVELSDVQGNILRGFGFRSAHYLFVHVPAGQQWNARRWLSRLCDEVMSGEEWRDGRNPQHALNVAVTYEGFKALGVPKHVRKWFPREFREGMGEEKRSRLLGDTVDSDPSKWTGWRPEDKTPHILLTILAHDRQVMHARVEAVRSHIPDGLDQLDISMDAGLFRHPDLERTDAREHFGFADGFSQPAIRGMPATPSEQGMGTLIRPGEWSALAPGEFVLGYPGEDGIVPESLGEDCIVPESPGEDAIAPESPAAPLGRSGSFMVVRKLQQHVDRFRSYLYEKATKEDLPFLRHLPLPADPEEDPATIARRQRFLAAKIVGRWHDGTSLVKHPDAPPRSDDARDPKRINNFTYDQDTGAGCPLGAHVRRANPRDDFGFFGNLSRRHRIVRRGMPYGRETFEPFETDPEKERPEDYEEGGLFGPTSEAEAAEDRGLVFICFQASIARQFEIIQGRWLNDGDSFWLGKEKDFLTIGPQDGGTTNGTDGGKAPDGDGKPAGRMTIQGKRQPSFLTPQPSFVTMKGGEYFFAPGLSALRALASGYWL